jgi:5-methylcytosine-specific restriction endonuclease McrA
MASEANKRNRPDQNGKHEVAFKRNKKKILASENICGICGQIVDKRLKYPHPLSPCIDHIIPIDRGGHPSDIENLQLAHWKCNRDKANKLIYPKKEAGIDAQRKDALVNNTNRQLPLTMDWSNYHQEEKNAPTDAEEKTD